MKLASAAGMPGLLICLLAVTLVACSIEKRGAPGTDPDAQLELGVQTDSLEIIVNAPPVARPGDSVPVTIRVRNTTARTLDLALLGRDIVFDITVMHADSIVWQRLHGQTIPNILQLKSLQPNDVLEFSDAWHAAVPAGSYQLSARVPTDADPLEPDPLTITIRE